MVEALSYGVAYDRVRPDHRPRTGDVVSKAGAACRPTRHDGHRARPGLSELVERYRRGSRRWPAGSSATRRTSMDNEGVDRLAVDAQRAFAGADIAFLDSGNTRADIDAGPITYADAFEVQAYEHPVWRLYLRGIRLLAVMHDEPNLLVSGPPAEEIRPDAVYTVAANGILLKRAPFDHPIEREKVGTDLQALVASLQRRG